MLNWLLRVVVVPALIALLSSWLMQQQERKETDAKVSAVELRSEGRLFEAIKRLREEGRSRDFRDKPAGAAPATMDRPLPAGAPGPAASSAAGPQHIGLRTESEL